MSKEPSEEEQAQEEVVQEGIVRLPPPARRGGMNRRRGDTNGNGASPPWLVSFTDIMALMLTFFVLLYAMSEPEEKSWSDVVAAMQKEFHVFDGPRQAAGEQDVINIDRMNFNRALPLSYVHALMESFAQDAGDTELFKFHELRGELVISLSGDALFESGQTDMQEDGLRQLYKLGSTLSKIRNRIEVVGHSDPSPITNPASQYASNWELSLDRAASVAEILKKVGYTRPILVKGAGSVHYSDLPSEVSADVKTQLSRRVDIHILPDDGRRSRAQRLRLE